MPLWDMIMIMLGSRRSGVFVMLGDRLTARDELPLRGRCDGALKWSGGR